MARVTRHAALSVLGLALGAVPGTTQVMDSAVVRSVPICQSVKPGSLVRVSTGHHGDQVGPVTRCDSLEIMVGPYLYPVDYVVPAAAVKRLWVQERAGTEGAVLRSEEHTSELQSQSNLVCRLLLEKKKKLHDAKS